MIDPFVMAANDNEMRFLRKLVRHLLIKPPPGGRHQNDFRLSMFDVCWLVFKIFHGGKNRFRLHHHPLPAAKGRVINHVMFVGCPIAQVVNVNIRDSFFLRAFHDALAQWRTTDLRKQRDDIDLHWENVERSPLNVQHRIVGRLTRSLPLSCPGGLPVYVARVSCGSIL